MAQSVYERERLVEVNRLLPDIRDFLRDVKNESLSSEIIEQCDTYIERLDAIIQPPSLPPRSGRAHTVSYNEQSSEVHGHAKLAEKLSRELTESDVVSSEYLEQQRELSRQATKKLPLPLQSPYNSQRTKTTKTADLREEMICPATGKVLIDRQSAIYEKILSTSSPPEEGLLSSSTGSALTKLPEPPPVPARGGKSRLITTNEHIQNNEKTVVMVHDLKDPLYSGLLRNVRANIKQWGVIMSQKLYLFNDLENPANFIGDLRFYEVKRDNTTKNVFHVTGSDLQSIVLGAVNDAQYQLWYNAFRRAKILSDAAVGIINGSGEMAEYVSAAGSAEYVSVIDDEYDENDYEQPNDSIGTTLQNNSKPPSESYMSMSSMSPPKISSSSIVYEEMGSTEQLDIPQLSNTVERENSWQSQGSIPLGMEEEDYTTLPLPPLPSPSEDKPPELPLRGHKVSLSISSPIGVISPGGKLYTKSEDEGSLSDNNNNLVTGSMPSLDSLESENGVRTKDRSLSTKTASLPPPSKLKRMRENEFMSDDSALFSGILHKRKILAVWQKHYCKVKDACLICYRSLDNNEASYEIKLPGYQLDRADETWRKCAFKLHNDSDVFYFAAENRPDLVKWLNVLAKEMNKERFVAIKDPDLLEMPRQSLNHQESTDESEGSQPNVNQSKRDDINDHTSDFDADNESGESEHSDKKCSITEPLPKNFLQVSKNRRLRTREDDSPEEPDAQIQGYLFRKFHNHWTRRWCSIKADKFFIYRHSPRDLPEAVIIMQFAAMTIPSDDGIDRSAGWYFFKITYEAEQTILLSTKSKEDWFSWRKCIEEHIGSLSEEPFPYINVPASSTMQKNINSHFFPTDEDEADDFNAYEPVAISSPLDAQELLSSSAPTGKGTSLRRSESELDSSYYYGYMTKIETIDNVVDSVEQFVVLTKDKFLKLYSEKNAIVPISTYNALTVEFINEFGADPSILRLSVLEDKKELVLKARNQYICDEWREKLNMIHYAEIDDNFGCHHRESADFSYDMDKTTPTEKMFRKRSKSIDRQTKNEPVLISHSKTLPHMGRLKKRAKEQNNTATKSKRLSYQRSEDQAIPSKKGLSSFIRSFTVDTLGRKAKNKTFEFSDDITSLKETQHGHLTEVVFTKNSVTHEQRYCRISGKVLYCHASKNEMKHIWKVSLTNAIIEDNIEDNLFKIKVTALDTGEEYNLLLNSDEELNDWVEAMSGEDKLHPNTSPKISRSNGMKPTTDLRRDVHDILPLLPRKDTPPRSDTLPRNQSAPALPIRMPSTIEKKLLSTSLSVETPPLPLRIPSREQIPYDVEDTPSTHSVKPPLLHQSHSLPLEPPHEEESPPEVPSRLESRPSYKTKPELDSTAVSMDRIPLSGNVNGIDKQQLTHTLSNNEGAPPLLETSPPVPRRVKNNRENTNSPLLVEHNQTSAIAVEKNSLSPTLSINSEILPSNDSPSTNKDVSMETGKENISPMEVEADGPGKWLSAISGSLSSLSSSNTTSTLSSTVTRSTLSETEFLSRSKSKEQKLSEDDVLLEEFMHEIRQKELSKTKLLRWIVLRKSVLEVYVNDREKTPCKIINLENSSLLANDKTSASNQQSIRLKDAEGFITEFLPQSSTMYKKWVSQIKNIEKSFRRNSKANTKLPIVGDIIKRRDRSIKQLKSDADNRKSLCLVEDDYKAVQKYEESTDLSRTIAGLLIEYFEDDKPEEKNRHCWIKDGFFYVAKESKTQKAIKKIDLSTVVILDESDPSKHNYAFKLNYTKDNKERCIMLKAPNQNAADKWMVSVSMGILLHRLKSPQVRNSYEIEEHSDKDHEFVQLPPCVSTPTYPSHADDFELGIDIKREIAKKAEDGEEHFVNVSELLRNEFPTPHDSPLPRRKEELIENKEVADGVSAKNEKLLPPTTRFSQLPNADDVVFSEDEEEEEMLENIPDRDNANERFKNVRGILKQQESIRRAIIHRQRSDASSKVAVVTAKKKIPPKTKPKPSRSKVSVSNNVFDVIKESFVVVKDNIDGLSMSELHNYNQQLESEKTTLQNYIRETHKKETERVYDVPHVGDSPTEASHESTTLLLAQDRLYLITNELSRVSSQITRCVSKRFGERDSGLYSSGRFKHYGSADCLLYASRHSYLNEKGYTSEPPTNDDSASCDQLDDLSGDTNSIII